MRSYESLCNDLDTLIDADESHPEAIYVSQEDWEKLCTSFLICWPPDKEYQTTWSDKNPMYYRRVKILWRRELEGMAPQIPPPSRSGGEDAPTPSNV